MAKREHEDDEDYTIEGLKNGNVNENENEGKQTTSMRSRRSLESESEESVEKSVKNVTKLLQGRPGLRDTQVRNTNTPLSCLQEVTGSCQRRNSTPSNSASNPGWQNCYGCLGRVATTQEFTSATILSQTGSGCHGDARESNVK